MSNLERIAAHEQEEVHLEDRPTECTERPTIGPEDDAPATELADQQTEGARIAEEEEVFVENLHFGRERQEHARLQSESAESTGFDAPIPGTSQSHCSCEETKQAETRNEPSFERTHSQTRIVHCMIKDSFHFIPDSRPVEMCPGCSQSGLNFQQVHLVPGAGPIQVNVLNIPNIQGGSLSPGSSYYPDFNSDGKLRSSQPSTASSRQFSSPTLSSRSTPSNVSTISNTIHCKYEHLIATLHKSTAFKKYFNEVSGIASSPWTNDIYVVDSGNDRIVVLDEHGKDKLSFGSHGTGRAQFHSPQGIAVSDRDEIIVADYWNDRVQIFDLNGNHKRTIKQFGGKGSLNKPMSVAYIDGLIFVCDAEDIRSFRYNGQLVTKYKSHILNPWAIARGPNNTFVILDVPYHKLYKFTSDGVEKESMSVEQSGLSHQLHHGVTVDSEGYTLITSPVEERIDVFSPWGNRLCCRLTGEKLGPVFDVAVLNDGRVAAACKNKVVIFQTAETQRPSTTSSRGSGSNTTNN